MYHLLVSTFMVLGEVPSFFTPGEHSLGPQNIWEQHGMKEIPSHLLPKHVFIIPDGNRRRARKDDLEPIEGHQMGLQKTLELLRALEELPIDNITFWAFSENNWKRPQEEVSGLMTMLHIGIASHLEELHEKGMKFVHLGDKERIRSVYPPLADTLEEGEKLTQFNTKKTISIAIGFGGEEQDERIDQQLLDMAYDAAQKGEKLTATRELRHSLRDGNGSIPPADLIIRTSGEFRTSDPGWLEGEQTELYVTDKLFPDVTIIDVLKAFENFAARERRLGR